MGGLINLRPRRGRCRANFSNTGGPPLPRKRSPFQKKFEPIEIKKSLFFTTLKVGDARILNLCYSWAKHEHVYGVKVGARASGRVFMTTSWAKIHFLLSLVSWKKKGKYSNSDAACQKKFCKAEKIGQVPTTLMSIGQVWGGRGICSHIRSMSFCPEGRGKLHYFSVKLRWKISRPSSYFCRKKVENIQRCWFIAMAISCCVLLPFKCGLNSP